MRSPVVNLLLQSDLATNFVGVYVSPNRLSPDGLYYYISYLERDIISITVKSCELSHVCVGGGGTVSTASSSLDYFVCGNKLRAICQQKRHHHLPTGWVDPIWGDLFLIRWWYRRLRPAKSYLFDLRRRRRRRPFFFEENDESSSEDMDDVSVIMIKSRNKSQSNVGYKSNQFSSALRRQALHKSTFFLSAVYIFIQQTLWYDRTKY